MISTFRNGLSWGLEEEHDSLFLPTDSTLEFLIFISILYLYQSMQRRNQVTPCWKRLQHINIIKDFSVRQLRLLLQKLSPCFQQGELASILSINVKIVELYSTLLWAECNSDLDGVTQSPSQILLQGRNLLDSYNFAENDQITLSILAQPEAAHPSSSLG